MTRPLFEKKSQPWHCNSCGAVNYSTHYKQCGVCLSPAPIIRERQSIARRTMLVRGMVTGATLLGSGGLWVAVTTYLLSRRPQPKPGQPILEVPIDPNGPISDSGDFSWPAIAWSPDGSSIACSAMVGKPVSKGVIIVDVKSGQTKWTHQEASGRLDAIAWSPDGTRLALAGRSFLSFPRPSSFIQIWLVQGWQKVAEFPVSKNDAQWYLACGQLVWSPDGTRLAGFNDSGDSQLLSSVQVWNASNGQVLFHQEATPISRNLLLSWLPDGHSLATSWQLGEIHIWDTRTGTSLSYQDPYTPSTSGSGESEIPQFLSGPSAAISPNGQRAVLYTMQQSQLVILLWDVRTASPIFHFQPIPGQHWCLTWSPDGKYIAECQANSSPVSIRFWNPESGTLALSYDAPAAEQLTWSPNGHFLATITHYGPSISRIISNLTLQILEVT